MPGYLEGLVRVEDVASDVVEIGEVERGRVSLVAGLGCLQLGNRTLLGLGWWIGYLLYRPDEITQRPNRLIVFFDDALGEKGVPDVRIRPLLQGGSLLGEILRHDGRQVQEEDELAILLRVPLYEDGCLDPVVHARFDDVFDLEAGPRY